MMMLYQNRILKILELKYTDLEKCLTLTKSVKHNAKGDKLHCMSFVKDWHGKSDNLRNPTRIATLPK
jgi:hypothetical protein